MLRKNRSQIDIGALSIDDEDDTAIRTGDVDVVRAFASQDTECTLDFTDTALASPSATEAPTQIDIRALSIDGGDDTAIREGNAANGNACAPQSSVWTPVITDSPLASPYAAEVPTPQADNEGSGQGSSHETTRKLDGIHLTYEDKVDDFGTEGPEGVEKDSGKIDKIDKNEDHQRSEDIANIKNGILEHNKLTSVKNNSTFEDNDEPVASFDKTEVDSIIENINPLQGGEQAKFESKENGDQGNDESSTKANLPWWTNGDSGDYPKEAEEKNESQVDHWWTSYIEDNENKLSDEDKLPVLETSAENGQGSASQWWENADDAEKNDAQQFDLASSERTLKINGDKGSDQSHVALTSLIDEKKTVNPMMLKAKNTEASVHALNNEKELDCTPNQHGNTTNGANEESNYEGTAEELRDNEDMPVSQASRHLDISTDEVSSFTSNVPSTREPRPVQFHNPYPLPQAPPPPRSPEEIIKDNAKPEKDLRTKWTQPKQELQEVLLAAKGSSLARRSNACGALKVLASKKKKQYTLAHTVGLLDSLVFAANESPPSAEADVAVDARTRAVTAIMYLSDPKENRVTVFEHPGLAATLVKVIEDDIGEARLHACSALAMLAKTASNRTGMMKVEGLTKALSAAVRGRCDADGFLHPSILDEVEFSSSTKVVSPPRDKHSYNIKNDRKIQYDKFLSLARLNACAALSHLSKYCPVSAELCQNGVVLDNILAVCIEFESPIHTRCIEILCNFTRFQANNSGLSHNNKVVDTLLQAGKSKLSEDRKWAIRAMQNLTSEPSSKVILATSNLLTVLSISAMRKEYDEQHAAVAALMNLATEPGAIVPLTNTKNVVATLVHTAHSPDSSSEVRKMACDALATIGLWLQTLAGAGTVPDDVPDAVLPTHKATGWLRWE